MRLVFEYVQAIVVTGFVLLCAVQLTSCSKSEEVSLKMNAKEIETVKNTCLALPEVKSSGYSAQETDAFCGCYANALAEYCDYEGAKDGSSSCIQTFANSGRTDSCASLHLHAESL